MESDSLRKSVSSRSKFLKSEFIEVSLSKWLHRREFIAASSSK